jgi:aminoglycoside 6'-N-acetyltransferase
VAAGEATRLSRGRAWIDLPIVTPRLVIRRFRPEQDLPHFQAYRNDPDVGRYQGWRAAGDAAALAFLAQQAVPRGPRPGAWVQLAIALGKSGLLVGDIGVRRPRTPGRPASIGYSLARAAQGRGLATEAVGAVVDALLRSGRVQAVAATTDTRNLASVALLRRLNFRLIATQRVRFRDEWCEEHHFLREA